MNIVIGAKEIPSCYFAIAATDHFIFTRLLQQFLCILYKMWLCFAFSFVVARFWIFENWLFQSVYIFAFQGCEWMSVWLYQMSVLQIVKKNQLLHVLIGLKCIVTTFSSEDRLNKHRAAWNPLKCFFSPCSLWHIMWTCFIAMQWKPKKEIKCGFAASFPNKLIFYLPQFVSYFLCFVLPSFLDEQRLAPMRISFLVVIKILINCSSFGFVPLRSRRRKTWKLKLAQRCISPFLKSFQTITDR